MDMTWHDIICERAKKKVDHKPLEPVEHRMTASINAIQGWLANRRVDKVLQLHSWRSEGDEQPAHVKGLYKTSESFCRNFKPWNPASVRSSENICGVLEGSSCQKGSKRRRLDGGYRLQQRLNTQGQRSQTWNEDALLKSTSRSSRSKKEPHSSLCGSAW